MLATPRGRQASQDGRRHSPHGSLSPASTTGSDIPEFQTEDTPHILTKLTEVRNFLAKEISNSTKEVKAEIQALGARTAALEDKMEQITSAHNSVVTHSRTMRQQITDLEMIVEDLANRSRRNNVRLRGLPESPQEGDLKCLFYVMEYVNGGDLEQFLDRHGKLDRDAMRFIATDLVCGLQYLHRNSGLSNAEVQKENIMKKLFDEPGREWDPEVYCIVFVKKERRKRIIKDRTFPRHQESENPPQHSQRQNPASIEAYRISTCPYRIKLGYRSMKQLKQLKQYMSLKQLKHEAVAGKHSHCSSAVKEILSLGRQRAWRLTTDGDPRKCPGAEQSDVGIRSSHLKIADFGRSENVFDYTDAHDAGTRGYMAPEMLRSKRYNAGADRWSFGVIL
ncbi:kinase C delta type-like [Pelobates cultripes]|uniref:Kinase C delta type-like n=1 Tax=Pelobates cultripes TaxID=61616 RepID=A0AAD1TII1_PELCU|nr:kinase C delta type-like [Pelobates cultripes]